MFLAEVKWSNGSPRLYDGSASAKEGVDTWKRWFFLVVSSVFEVSTVEDHTQTTTLWISQDLQGLAKLCKAIPSYTRHHSDPNGLARHNVHLQLEGGTPKLQQGVTPGHRQPHQRKALQSAWQRPSKLCFERISGCVSWSGGALGCLLATELFDSRARDQHELAT